MTEPRYRVQLPDGRMTKSYTRGELSDAMDEGRLPGGCRVEVGGNLVSPESFVVLVERTSPTQYRIPAFKPPGSLVFSIVVSGLAMFCSAAGCLLGLLGANTVLFIGGAAGLMFALFMIAFAETSRAVLQTLHHIRIATERQAHDS